MGRRVAGALALAFTITLAGCQSAPQAQPTQTRQQSVESDGYNRGNEAETHRHGRGDRARKNDWSSAMEDGRSEQGSGFSRGRSSRALTAAPGQFDFYVLNLSWSPEFCFKHRDAAECAQHRLFTLHGLWPENKDGSYPEHCSEAPGPTNPSRYADLFPDAGLLQHEWQTHGTCSGLGADTFFALARRAEQSVQIPPALANISHETTLAPAQILAQFAESNPSFPSNSFALTCGSNYLTAVEVCMDQGLRPESCAALRSCRANQVRVVPPE